VREPAGGREVRGVDQGRLPGRQVLAPRVGRNRASARIAPICAVQKEHRCNAAVALLHPTILNQEERP
jgi:hypothetical protein